MHAPGIYLLVSLAGALLTALSLFRGPRRGALPTLFFAGGMIVGDVAPWHIAWQVLATLGFAAAGAFTAWPGWVRLYAVTLASWAGLAVAVARAKQAAAAIEAALCAALGADYRAAIAPEVLAQVGDDRAAGLLAEPVPPPRARRRAHPRHRLRTRWASPSADCRWRPTSAIAKPRRRARSARAPRASAGPFP